MEGWNKECSTSRKVTVVIEIAGDIAVKRRTKLNMSQKQTAAEKMNLNRRLPFDTHARSHNSGSDGHKSITSAAERCTYASSSDLPSLDSPRLFSLIRDVTELSVEFH